ncbi:MAG TPA: hypothetical protein VHQ46_02125 [Desulfobacteria bacterium]|nr:hypothetical protein [Desulfobacteria bacterium]
MLHRCLLIVMLVFLLVISAAYIGVNVYVSATNTCINCHRAAAAGWQKSTHALVACQDCHSLNTVGKGAMLARYYLSRPILIEVTNRPCQNCHNPDRIVTPDGDLIVPHREHLAQNITCVQCHLSTGHLKSDQTAGDGDVQQTAGGEKLSGQSGAVKAAVGMGVCLTCHYQRNGPLGCEKCHRNPPVTLEHKSPDWLNRHGTAALRDLAQCNTCHRYTLFLDRRKQQDFRQVLTEPALYARANTFCTDCHRKPPATHTAYFAHDHAFVAVDNERSCLVCHSFAYPLPVEQVPELYCGQCHLYQGYIPLPFSQLARKAH